MIIVCAYNILILFKISEQAKKKSLWPLEGMFSLNYYKWRGKLHYSSILFLKTLLREKVCGSGVGQPPPHATCLLIEIICVKWWNNNIHCFITFIFCLPT